MTEAFDQIPAFHRQIIEMARDLASIGLQEPDTALWQRYACVIVQARAQECRKLAGGLLLNPGPLVNVAASGSRADATMVVRKMASDLEQRSHELEALGLSWAQQWPPENVPAPGKLVMVQ